MAHGRDLTDAELQAKVVALSGALNLRKQQQETPFAPNQQYHQGHHYAGHAYRGGAHLNNRWSPFPLRGGRGRGRGGGAAFQNRRLVLNGSSTPAAPSVIDNGSVQEADLLTDFAQDAALPPPPVEAPAARTHPTVGTPRNSTQPSGQMQRAMPAKPSIQQIKNQEEKKRLATHFQKTGATRTMEIDGIRFIMKEDGSKLIRVTDSATAKKTPLKHTIAGVEFQRTKTGNLLRVALKGPARPAQKTAPQCEHFIKNGTSQFTPHMILDRPDTDYRHRSVGTCPYGPKCRFDHNPEKVAICKAYFHSGRCQNGDHCDLSHKPTYKRVPACTYSLQGNCTNDACRYAHVQVSPGPLVCRPFAVLGYCDKGVKCDKRHVYECPDYAETGECANYDTGKCKLQHVRRAHLERQKARPDDDSELESESEQEVVEDIDSDDAANPDDVVMSGADGPGHGFSQNQDFVSF